MKLLLISASLHKNGFAYKVNELEVEEKPSTYVTPGGKRISKNAILHVDTNLKENHRHIQFFTYCFESQRLKVLNLLKEHVLHRLSVIAGEIQEVFKASEGEFSEERS